MGCCGSGEKESDLDWFEDVGDCERGRERGDLVGDGDECAGVCERDIDSELDADRDRRAGSESGRECDCEREKSSRYFGVLVGLLLKTPLRCDNRLGGRKSSGFPASTSGELEPEDGVSPVLRRL